MTSFSGSYRADDVQMLLKRLPQQAFVSVAEKEALIQAGRRHYSEMLSAEALPSDRYLALFEHACRTNRERMARDCLVLAGLIAERRPDDIAIVSLARAGTPVGVIVKHLLARALGRPAAHYTVSIIRDRGIDAVALQAILARHAPESIVFVDGWTGKGAISRELHTSVAQFNARHGVAIDSGLFVLADLAGTAACASSGEDYLIPSSILNATVSGLISRTVLNEAIGPDDFHGCLYFDQFAPHDRSRSFVDDIIEAALALEHVPAAAPLDRERAAATSLACLHALSQQYGIADVNLIKPGIGEATRVLLRRVPRLLLLRDPAAPEVAHLAVLAREKNVPVAVDGSLPYQAVSLIRSGPDA